MQLPIENDTYQVFLLTCAVSMPYVFARHPWFVVNKKGDIARWEVIAEPNEQREHWGHLHKNFFDSPVEGLDILKGHIPDSRWSSVSLQGVVSGEEVSLAHRMIAFIENTPNTYPHLDEYRTYPGPNSNTFAQWVLNHFPESELTLPWNAFGKNFKQ